MKNFKDFYVKYRDKGNPYKRFYEKNEKNKNSKNNNEKSKKVIDR